MDATRSNRPAIALAAAAGNNVLGTTGTFTYAHLVNVIVALVLILVQIGGILGVGAIIWYGMMMALAGGDVAKFAAARKNLLYAFLGLLIILGVYTIIATVRGAVDSIGT